MEYRKIYLGKLYHFCAGRFLPGIKKKGIRFGKIPFSKDGITIKLLPGYQWLTVNNLFNQSWCEDSSLPYDRTEYRITINLPKVERFNLIKWTDFNKDHPNKLFDTLNEFGDFENWYLYKGVIIPYWLSSIDKKGSAKLTKPDQITETDRKESV